MHKSFHRPFHTAASTHTCRLLIGCLISLNKTVRLYCTCTLLYIRLLSVNFEINFEIFWMKLHVHTYKWNNFVFCRWVFNFLYNERYEIKRRHAWVLDYRHFSTKHNVSYIDCLFPQMRFSCPNIFLIT